MVYASPKASPSRAANGLSAESVMHEAAAGCRRERGETSRKVGTAEHGTQSVPARGQRQLNRPGAGANRRAIAVKLAAPRSDFPAVLPPRPSPETGRARK